MSRIPLILCAALISGCQMSPTFDPIRTESFVDLQRFAGDWYVISSIPTFIEKNAYAAVETYEPPIEGKIKTTFSFNHGSLDGEKKTYHPTGFVRDDGSNAIWGMQFVWPIQAEYRIVYIDPDYQYTIIGRSKRDYVWIMSRQPVINEKMYASLVQILIEEDYDIAKLRLVPQRNAS
jgi:apolipoprotein D and lipocalin family protein